jgi:DNA-binding NarL/FixJ family response regulator
MTGQVVAADFGDDEVDQETKLIRVLVVDDHRVFAEAIALALSGQPNLDIVGTAHSVTAGLAMAEQLVPDLVLMDVRLGDGDGVAATAQLTRLYPSMSVVILTGFADRGLMERVRDAGASALLPKNGELSEMLQALRTARRGRFVVHPTLLRALGGGEASSTTDVMVLDARERDLLRLLAAGFDAAAVARELDRPLLQAKLEVKELLAKLGAESHLDAVAVAMRTGLLRDAAFG